MTKMLKTMRAAVWAGVGESLSVQHIPVPRPRRGEVRLKVAACGVCHSDLHVLRGEIGFPAPAVLGHEISGVVDLVGSDVIGLEPGDRVVASFILPCGECWQCVRERDELCETFFQENRVRGRMLDGSSRLTAEDGSELAMYSMGGLAEFAVVPWRAAARIPDSMPLEEAAILGCAGLTAFGAVGAAEGVRKGCSAAVIGVGGVGSSIVQILSHLGARPIIAVDIDDIKLESARRLGAHVALDGRDPGFQDLVVQATDGRGVEVAFEALGQPGTLEQGLSMLASGGRLVAVGIADRDAGIQVPITSLVRRGLSIVGSFGGSPTRDLPHVISLAETGSFQLSQLVSARYPIEQAQQAYDDLASRKIPGRALITMTG